MTLLIKVGIATRYKFISYNPKTGIDTPLSGWSNNKLCTSGRNELANRNWFSVCKVGTDNTVPSAGHTDLLGYIASTSTVVEDTWGAQASAPYFGWRRKRFRFAVGAAGGEILAEVSLGWASGVGDNIVARSLIVDINEVQTTITPLADEILDVLIEVRYYPPLSDATGTVDFNSVTYDYILRAANVTSSTSWAASIGNKIQSFATDVSHWKVYDDDIGAINLSPNGLGTNSDNDNDYTNAYSNNSYQIVFGMIVGPTGWNSLTGKLMRSLYFMTTAGHYQVQFDSQVSPGNGIPKTSAKIITTQFTLGWDEEIIP